MTNENKDPMREFLESYWEARRESERLGQRVKELTSQSENITSKYGISPRGGGGSEKSVWDALIESKNRVEEKLVESLEREAAVEEFIDSLDNELYRELLRYRYLSGLTWADIGELLNYNPDHARRRLHGEALNAARLKWEEKVLREGTMSASDNF